MVKTASSCSPGDNLTIGVDVETQFEGIPSIESLNNLHLDPDLGGSPIYQHCCQVQLKTAWIQEERLFVLVLGMQLE